MNSNNAVVIKIQAKITADPNKEIQNSHNMSSSNQTSPYLNHSLSLSERIEDLLSRLTLEEKAGIMLYDAKSIDRLDIPAYNWWNECLHGVARAGRATVFPQAISLAATFDVNLVKRIADAIGDEGRAKHHAAVRNGIRAQYLGLTFWTPNINIFRDPRWGRGQETYGEDPFLTARMGVAFVQGLQGDHPKYMKAAGCAKHFAVHSGPEGVRHQFNAECSEQDLWETYLPAFEALVVEGGVEAVMGAYNRTNGEPCCAHSLLMEDILRGKWKFEGHYVSDCWALRDFHEHHKITKDVYESCALAIKKGCDLNCGNSYEFVLEAVNRGLLKESDIDVSIRRLLRAWFRLGFFDPPEENPYTQIPDNIVGCQKHRQLALESAEKSIVLLKNEKELLPLKPTDSFMLTGTNAASVDMLLGNYFGVSDHVTTIVEGIAKRLPAWKRMEYRSALRPEVPNENPQDWVFFEAGRYDLVVAVLGLSPWMEGEEGDAIATRECGDRPDPCLPPHQYDYLCALKETGTKIVLILCGGSSMILGKAAELADAILWIGYPGESGGEAVAKVLFGEVAPSGKLPITFYKSVDDLPPFEDYSMEGRTYRFMDTEPEFPFGFGLSYTQFSVDNLQQAPENSPKGKRDFTVDVANTGPVAGEEVVQLYVRSPEAGFRTPRSSLRAFHRVKLPAGESKQLRFSLDEAAFAMINGEGEKVILPGTYEVVTSLASPGPRSEALEVPMCSCTLELA